MDLKKILQLLAEKSDSRHTASEALVVLDSADAVRVYLKNMES